MVTLLTALHSPLPAKPPQKQLVYGNAVPSDLLGQLNGLGSDLQVSMSVSNQPVKNIVLLSEYIQNTGDFPVATKDYQGNLGFSIAKPWRVVAISSVGNDPLTPKWSKVSDQSYETQPVLFNPGDKLSLNIYVTDPDTSSPPALSIYEIGFHWYAHIEGVQSILPAQSSPAVLQQIVIRPTGVIVVTFDDIGLIFFFVMAALFIASYLYLLDENGARKQADKTKYIIFVVGTSLLSVSAAEAVTTLVWTSTQYGTSVRDLLALNAPPIVLNICVMGGLLFGLFTRPKDFGLKNLDPAEHAILTIPAIIKGSLNHLPPKSWKIWVFTTDAEGKGHWPQAKGDFIGTAWELTLRDANGFRARNCWIQLFVVGPVGQTQLLEYRSAGQRTGHWPSCPLPDDSLAVSPPLHYINGLASQ